MSHPPNLTSSQKNFLARGLESKRTLSAQIDYLQRSGYSESQLRKAGLIPSGDPAFRDMFKKQQPKKKKKKTTVRLSGPQYSPSGGYGTVTSYQGEMWKYSSSGWAKYSPPIRLPKQPISKPKVSKPKVVPITPAGPQYSPSRGVGTQTTYQGRMWEYTSSRGWIPIATPVKPGRTVPEPIREPIRLGGAPKPTREFESQPPLPPQPAQEKPKGSIQPLLERETTKAPEGKRWKEKGEPWLRRNPSGTYIEYWDYSGVTENDLSRFAERENARLQEKVNRGTLTLKQAERDFNKNLDDWYYERGVVKRELLSGDRKAKVEMRLKDGRYSFYSESGRVGPFGELPPQYTPTRLGKQEVRGGVIWQYTKEGWEAVGSAQIMSIAPPAPKTRLEKATDYIKGTETYKFFGDFYETKVVETYKKASVPFYDFFGITEESVRKGLKGADTPLFPKRGPGFGELAAGIFLTEKQRKTAAKSKTQLRKFKDDFITTAIMSPRDDPTDVVFALFSGGLYKVAKTGIKTLYRAKKATSSIGKGFQAGVGIAGTTAEYGVMGYYGYQVVGEARASEKPGAVFGKALTTEIIPFGVGYKLAGFTGRGIKKGAGKTAEMIGEGVGIGTSKLSQIYGGPSLGGLKGAEVSIGARKPWSTKAQRQLTFSESARKQLSKKINPKTGKEYTTVEIENMKAELRRRQIKLKKKLRDLYKKDYVKFEREIKKEYSKSKTEESREAFFEFILKEFKGEVEFAVLKPGAGLEVYQPTRMRRTFPEPLGGEQKFGPPPPGKFGELGGQGRFGDLFPQQKRISGSKVRSIEAKPKSLLPEEAISKRGALEVKRKVFKDLPKQGQLKGKSVGVRLFAGGIAGLGVLELTKAQEKERGQLAKEEIRLGLKQRLKGKVRLKEISRLRLQERSRLREQERLKERLKERQKLKEKQKEKYKQRYDLRYETIQIGRSRLDVPRRPTPKRPRPTLFPGLFLPAKPKFGKRKEVGYNTYVKTKGKYQKVNPKPLTQRAAKSLGARFVDNTTAATYKTESITKVQKVKGKKKGTFLQRRVQIRFRKNELGNKDGYFNKIRPKLRAYKVKQKQKLPVRNKWIEKSRYRVDTRGEKRGLTVAKYKVQLGKRARGEALRKTRTIRRRLTI